MRGVLITAPPPAAPPPAALPPDTQPPDTQPLDTQPLATQPLATQPPAATPPATQPLAGPMIATAPPAAPPLETSFRYRLHPDVALRPEPFGALAYHYGSRRLTFLRSQLLADMVRELGHHDSVDAALSARVPEAQRPAYRRAMASLAESRFLERLPTAERPSAAPPHTPRPTECPPTGQPA